MKKSKKKVAKKTTKKTVKTTTKTTVKKAAKKPTQQKKPQSVNKTDFNNVIFTRPENIDRCLVIAEKGKPTIHIKPEFRIYDDGKWWDDLSHGVVLKNHTEARNLIKALTLIVGE